MALTKYCPSCGGKNYYEVVSPKFCSNCGESFTKTVVNSSIKITNQNSSRGTPHIPNEDQEDNFKIVEASLDDVEISEPRKLTIGDLAKIENKISRPKNNPMIPSALPNDMESSSRAKFSSDI
jgi:hypothetical protein